MDAVTEQGAPSVREHSMALRVSVFAYGVVAYLMFLGVFVYAFGFTIGAWGEVTLDSPATGPFWTALVVDALLLGVFALQHSVMARPVFKRWITRFIPVEAERSTYVMVSNLLMIGLFVWWRPMGGVVWDVQAEWARWALYAVGGLGWLTVLVSTFLINHFDLFGLRQVWQFLRGEACTPLKFVKPFLYKYVRHPIYVGWFLAFWGAPTMTGAHLFFAILTAVYMLVAIQFEERDLVAEHGEKYLEYRKEASMLAPLPRRRSPSAEQPA